MRFSYASRPFDDEGPARSDIAALALKFRADHQARAGREQEDWLCAEYLLTQRELIARQLAGIHKRNA